LANNKIDIRSWAKKKLHLSKMDQRKRRQQPSDSESDDDQSQTRSRTNKFSAFSCVVVDFSFL